jgi:hypothetical protein
MNLRLRRPVNISASCIVGTIALAGITPSWAQSISVSPLMPAAVPVDHPAAILITAACAGWLAWGALRQRNSNTRLRRANCLGAALLGCAAVALWSPEVMAQLSQLQRYFTQPEAQTANVPIQATLDGNSEVTGFLPVVYTNNSGTTLRITSLTAAQWETCFPSGIPSSLPIQPSLGQPQCSVGSAMQPNASCWVDTAQLCADSATHARGSTPSVLAADTATGIAGEQITGNVLSNDHDADGQLIVASYRLQGIRYLAGQTASSTTLGSFTLNRNGQFTFTPANPFTHSPLVVTYTTHTGASNTLTVTVGAPNRPPLAVNDTATVVAGQSITLDVRGNDSDPDNDPLVVSSITQGRHGTVVIDGVSGNLVYQADAGYVGTDTFTYTVSDNRGGTASASVTITVVAANRPPNAGNDVASVQAPNSVSINALVNDSDPDGDPLVITSVTQGTHGSVILDAVTGQPVYTPFAGFNGTDAFTYTVSDGRGGTAMATVTMTVTPANTPPVALNDLATARTGRAVQIAVRSNDTDADNDPLTVTNVTQGTYGNVIIDTPSGNPVYQSTIGYIGSDSFTYTISDGRGGQSTATVAVSVAADTPSVLVADTASTDEDTNLPGNVLTNDSDADDVLQIVSFQIGATTYPAATTASFAEGKFTLQPDGSYLFEPARNFYGSVPVIRYVTQTNASSTLTITVNPVNDPPVAVDDYYVTEFEQPLRIALPLTVLTLNDTDPDGDSVNVYMVTNPVNGTLDIVGGDLVFTPSPGFSGEATFAYAIHDGHSQVSMATVHINVNPDTRAPVLIADVKSGDEDTQIIGNVLDNDQARNNTLSLVSFTIGGNAYPAGTEVVLPGKGKLVVKSNGHYQFDPETNYNGVLPTVTYTTTSTNAATGATAALSSTLDITINPVNDPPVAVDDYYVTEFEQPIRFALPLTVLTLNDTDPDGDSVNVYIVSNPVNGTIDIVNSDLVFTPSTGFSGEASFSYTIHDGNAQNSMATVHINVKPKVN